MTQTTLTGVRRAQGGIAERMFFSPAGLCSIAVSCVYLVVAIGFFNRVGLSAEAATRTAHLTNLVAGYDQSALAFGLERPPLPTLFGLLFATVPEFRTMGLAVAIGIALTGGLSVAVANGIGRWAGLGAKTHLLFVAAFAMHPLLLISGASGMPEALYATLLLAAFGQLLRWLDRESTTPLILAGVACGAAFLLRYDVLWVAAAIALCVYYVALTREIGIENLERAQATTVAFVVPVAFVVGFWTITAWFAHGDLLEFVYSAARLGALSANDTGVVAAQADMHWDLLATGAWLGVWTASLAPLSLLAIVGLAGFGLATADRAALALAGALASILLPEAASLLSGQGQAHVPHLFAFVVPAYILVAYIERRRGGGRRPFTYERGSRQRQLALCLLLVIAAGASIVRLPATPLVDNPVGGVLIALRANQRPAPAGDVAAAANWIRQNAAAGEVIVDLERSADVYLATAKPDYFRTPEDKNGPAVIANPEGVAAYILMRRPIPGTGRGAIERSYPTLWERGLTGFEVAFESGDYRIYRVPTPAGENRTQ